MGRLAWCVLVVGVLATGCNCGLVPVVEDGGDDGGADGGGGGAGGGGGSGSCTASVPCYTGPTGTRGVGACRDGVAQCLNGQLSACAGDVVPGAEACNGVDDDCNGVIDDATVLGTISCGSGACRVTVAACTNGAPSTCTPGTPHAEVCGDNVDNNCNGIIDEGCNCAYVAPSGVDTNPGTPALPVRTIGVGIAVASDAGFSQVCVASGMMCPSSAAYAEAVTMVSGISVIGAFAATPVAVDGGLGWNRGATCVTRIDAQDDRGVYFSPSVTAPTALDGFAVNGGNQATNAAITVEGSTGALINDVLATGGMGQTSVGVNVLSGAAPTIARSQVNGGNGSVLAVGVKSTGSRPTLSDNCSQYGVTGRCIVGCGNNQVRFVRGRLPGGGAGSNSYAVLLTASAGAIVERSALCSGPGTADVAAVRLSGDATGVIVRTSTLDGSGGGVNAVGFWADACAAASPWVFDNEAIAGSSQTMGARGDGVRAIGDCHPRIDSNQRIAGGVERSNNDAFGVYCAKDPVSGTSSRCTVQNNVRIQGAGAGYPPRATGVQCDVGACALIENNHVNASTGQRTFGVVLDGAGTVVRRNFIEAGCATQEGIGLLSIDSSARVENNEIRGSVCTGVAGPSTPTTTAVKVLLGNGANELDLHSNSIGSFGQRGACVSRGLTFDVVDGGAPTGARGLVRNNVFHAGLCNTATPVEELSTAADPRLFQNNDLFSPLDGGLYRDEAATLLPDSASVNALAGAAANLGADPQYADGGTHLSPGSPCRNTGTATGAPVVDIDGNSRPQENAFDIGSDEFVP